MHGDLCRFYHSLMLSQAQECVTEKSMLDSRPPALTAKLTKFLAESYEYCCNQLNSQTLASILPEKFLRLLLRKASVSDKLVDNDAIYHERAPPLAELEAVKGANVVKPTPFNHTDPEVIGQDIFKDLLPLETLQASSMYSEVKAEFLRKILAEVEEKDVALGKGVVYNPRMAKVDASRCLCVCVTKVVRGEGQGGEVSRGYFQ
ncbi:unnamed protein product [Dibothriocephalus latus]|uniref:BRO1 domain-containing protein n=1 Tax=Dibothriocephalus latus TaxID=60516 RepID=A0A3P7KVA2_DIBLA|nr:unnamed protein product [Dibothriocephalus latus]